MRYRPCKCVSTTHGRLTPAAPVCRGERLPVKWRLLRCTNACTAKSGGREPPVVRGSAFAMPPRSHSEHYRRFPGDRDCNNVRQPQPTAQSPACLRYRPCKCVSVHHGGLTPAAPVCRRERVSVKWRLSRCTNACTAKSGALAPRGKPTRGCPPRTCGGDRQHNVGSLSGRDHAMDCGLWATCSPNLSTTCQTIRRIAGCRGSDCLAGFLHSRRHHAMDCGLWAACSPNLSTNLPDHATDCGLQGKRLPRRISPQPATPCDGLRTIGGLLAESLHNLPDHAKDCGPQGKRAPHRICPRPARPCD
jgi:hypothetical protein